MLYCYFYTSLFPFKVKAMKQNKIKKKYRFGECRKEYEEIILTKEMKIKKKIVMRNMRKRTKIKKLKNASEEEKEVG